MVGVYSDRGLAKCASSCKRFVHKLPSVSESKREKANGEHTTSRFEANKVRLIFEGLLSYAERIEVSIPEPSNF